MEKELSRKLDHVLAGIIPVASHGQRAYIVEIPYESKINGGIRMGVCCRNLRNGGSFLSQLYPTYLTATYGMTAFSNVRPLSYFAPLWGRPLNLRYSAGAGSK